MRLLFIHNTMPEYRVPFFNKLNEKIDVDFLFTRMNLNKKIYGTDLEYNKITDIRFECLPIGTARYIKLISSLKKEKYDFVIIPPLDSLKDFLDCLIILINSKINRRKLLYFGEKWEAPIYTQPKKKRFKNFLQKCAFKVILNKVDSCIAAGSKSKEYFKSLGIKDEKISIAIDTSGVNTDIEVYDIKKEKKIDKDAKIILYYGRIIERKGLDILIKAYSRIYAKDNKAYLLVCGNGTFKDECEKLVQKMKLKNIIFIGFVKPDDKYIFFSQCDVFVLPSYFYNGTPEAWGLTVNEALQCGKPVIATEAVGAAHDLLNGKNGKLIKQNNVDELVEAIKEFLYDKCDEEIKEECLKTYDKFDYDNMVNSFILAINRCR